MSTTSPIPTEAATKNQRALKPFWQKRVVGYLKTQDGTSLRYSVLLPKGKGPFPVIVNYSGYDPGSIGGRAYLDGDTTMSASLDRTLVQNGYAVAGVNARGTACSSGEFAETGPSYGRDGRDAIEFFATQRWSNGKIGMANWSWAGISQLATAEQRPPHLKAIAPGMVVGDWRLDSLAPGGVPQPAMQAAWQQEYIPSRWAAAMASAKAEGDQACIKQINANLEAWKRIVPPTFALAHAQRDSAVEDRHFSAHASDIEVPVLSVKAFQDEAVTSREGHYQDRLRPDQLWMVQSNGPHDLYESLALRPTLVSFFDRFVKDLPNGFDRRPHLEVWLETSKSPSGVTMFEGLRPRTVYRHQTLPAATITKTFNLSANGTLSDEVAGSGASDAYDYPSAGQPVNAVYASDGWGPLPADWKTGSFAYTSPPLTASLVTFDSSSADLWVSSSATIDADLQVTITEVRPDGQEVYLQRGWLRLSDRALDEGRSTSTKPIIADRPDHYKALILDEPVLARVELAPFSHAFRAGSRLRIWIDTPAQTGEYAFDHTSLPTKISVLHDAAHPSKLVLSVLPDAKPELTLPQCGTSIMEPCRPDPLGTTAR